MAFDNFTVNIVSFNESAGADWTQSQPSVSLIITPNMGYEIDATNFAPISPLPPYVSSVTFSQSGANVECTILYITPSIMPSNDVLISLCITGSASLINLSIDGVIDYNTVNTALPVPSITTEPYSGSGTFATTSQLENIVVEANPGYYFPSTPTASLAIGSLANYSIAQTLTNDAEGNLIQVNFAVNYTFPNYSVTGDKIIVTGTAEELYNPAIDIQSYSINLGNVIISGETRPIKIFGITGAAWNLEVIESVGGTTIEQFSGVIDSSGLATENISFPLSLVDVDYTFILTGDLASSFCTAFPYTPCLTGQPSVWQLHQYAAQDVSFNLASSDTNITIGSADTKSFTPAGSPGLIPYSVSASKQGTSEDFIFEVTPINTDWSNQNGLEPVTNQVVQAPLTISVDNLSDPKTLTISLSTDIIQVGTQPLLSELDLDNFLLSYTKLTLCYASTETALCCGASESRTVFVQGDVTTLAEVTGALYTDATFQTKAADGYYSDDPSISCSTGPIDVIPVSILADSSGYPVSFSSVLLACDTAQTTEVFTVYTESSETEPALVEGMVLYTDENLTNVWSDAAVSKFYKIIGFNGNTTNSVTNVSSEGVLGSSTADCI